MEDFTQKLNEILGDEESMKQIRELADMLTGRSPLPGEASQEAPCENKNNDSAESFDRNYSDDGQNKSDSGMPDLSGLMSMLMGGGGTQQDGESGSGGIDFGALMQLSQALMNASEDNNRRLLLALRPFLCEDKQARLDKAVKMLKLYAVFTQLKNSGMLKDLDKLI